MLGIGDLSASGSLEYTHQIARRVSAIAGVGLRIDSRLEPDGVAYGGLRWRF